MRSNGKKKVIVAMSGGVDSSVTAALLLEQGYDVAGVSLRLWDYGDDGPRSCSDYRGAKSVAEFVGIPHTLLDARRQFSEAVVRPFAESYLRGRTPNPCVACNRDFKLGLLLRWAGEQGADSVATGHYARLVRDPSSGNASLLRGADRQKDQSYFLFALSREQLFRTMFPLGDWTKTQVRHKARDLGLPVAERPDSQDICFGDYQALVESFAEGSDFRGDIVDRSGKFVGRHEGIHRFTVGQRRGIGISAAHPLYVLEVDETSRRVVVGKRDELGSRGFVTRDVNWIHPPTEREVLAEVQIRYRSSSVPSLLRLNREGRWEVRFRDSFPVVTPGQAAVFYRGDEVLGGGWIERAIRA